MNLFSSVLIYHHILSHNYRSGLSGTSDINSQMIVSYIEDWVSSSPNVNIQGTLIKVDSECPVSITSYNGIDDLCADVVTTKPTFASNKNSQQSTDISGAIIGGVLVVLVIAIGLVVLLHGSAVESCTGEWSFKKFEQYVVTNRYKLYMAKTGMCI